MNEIELQIVNATGLDPTKVYLIEVDRAKVSDDTAHLITKGLTKLGIKGLVVKSYGGDGIHIIEQTTMEADRG